jgi:pimeloyl-ACP methyl ester carboxylesterase
VPAAPRPTAGLEAISPSEPTGLARFAAGHPGRGGTVVCVHGSLDGGRSFARLARRLDGRRVVAYDRRGYQGSRGIAPAAVLDAHVHDLLEVVAGVAGEGPVHVVGHSFGGVIALATTMRAPDDISALTVYEPPLPWLNPEQSIFLGVPPTGPPPAEVEAFFRRMVSDEAWERLSADERAQRMADGPALMGDLTIIRMSRPFKMTDVAELTVPVTIGVGDRNLAAPSALAAVDLVAATPMARLEVVADAGHGAHLTHPGRLAEMIMHNERVDIR